MTIVLLLSALALPIRDSRDSRLPTLTANIRQGVKFLFIDCEISGDDYSMPRKYERERVNILRELAYVQDQLERRRPGRALRTKDHLIGRRFPLDGDFGPRMDDPFITPVSSAGLKPGDL